MNRVLIAGLLVGVGALALAQSQPETTERPRVLTHPRAGMPVQEEGPRVTVDFKGGTLAEYVAALRAAQPAINIVIADAAAGASVPAVQLRDVRVDEAVLFLSEFRDERLGSFYVNVLGEVSTVAMEYSKVRLTAESTVVTSIGYMLNDGAKSDEILSALDAAVQTAGEHAEIKFHPQTSLVIIHANEKVQNVVKETLQALHYSSSARATKSVHDVERQIETLNVRVAALEKSAKPAGN